MDESGMDLGKSCIETQRVLAGPRACPSKRGARIISCVPV